MRARVRRTQKTFQNPSLINIIINNHHRHHCHQSSSLSFKIISATNTHEKPKIQGWESPEGVRCCALRWGRRSPNPDRSRGCSSSILADGIAEKNITLSRRWLSKSVWNLFSLHRQSAPSAGEGICKTNAKFSWHVGGRSHARNHYFL